MCESLLVYCLLVEEIKSHSSLVLVKVEQRNRGYLNTSRKKIAKGNAEE